MKAVPLRGETEGLANCLRQPRGALGHRGTALSACPPHADNSSVSTGPRQKASLTPRCTFINAHFHPFKSIPISFFSLSLFLSFFLSKVHWEKAAVLFHLTGSVLTPCKVCGGRVSDTAR